MPLIEVTNVSKTHHMRNKQLTALKRISFSVNRGETVAILGTSGCGKTTLLNALAGLEQITSGSVTIGKASIQTMTEDARAAFRLKHIGFIFQQYNLVSTLSVLDNVIFPLMLHGGARDSRRNAAEKMLAQLGLVQYGAHYPHELSGGQQQRVAIARALITKPEIILADEPTGNLDSKTANTVMEILAGLTAQQQATLLLVTHDSHRANQMSRTLLMSDGKITEKKERVF